MICDECKASEEIKSTLGCRLDRLINSGEKMKMQWAKELIKHYEPKFQCRFADLVNEEAERMVKDEAD